MDEELTKAEESAGLGRFGLKAEEEVVQNEVEGENEVGNMSELNINCTFMYIYVLKVLIFQIKSRKFLGLKIIWKPVLLERSNKTN